MKQKLKELEDEAAKLRSTQVGAGHSHTASSCSARHPCSQPLPVPEVLQCSPHSRSVTHVSIQPLPGCVHAHTNTHSQGGAAAAPDGMEEEGAEGSKEEADARSVFVNNVDFGTTPEELQQLFAGCGTVNRVTILADKFGTPKVGVLDGVGGMVGQQTGALVPCVCRLWPVCCDATRWQAAQFSSGGSAGAASNTCSSLHAVVTTPDHSVVLPPSTTSAPRC